MAAVPFAGPAAVGYLEERDCRAWLAAHPGSTSADYFCDIAEATAEVVDEMLVDLPKNLSLPEAVYPECDR